MMNNCFSMVSLPLRAPAEGMSKENRLQQTYDLSSGYTSLFEGQNRGCKVIRRTTLWGK